MRANKVSLRAFLTVGLLWPVASPKGIAAERNYHSNLGEIEQQLLGARLSRVSHQTQIAERITHLSATFLGFPYGLHPDSLVTSFDCTTFVEHVVTAAMVGSQASPTRYKSISRAIMFGDKPASILHYHHFPSLNWIPNFVIRGFGEDLTAELTRSRPLRWTKNIIDRKAWFFRMHPSLSEKLPRPLLEAEPKPVRIPYIPVRQFFNIHSETFHSREYLARLKAASLNIKTLKLAHAPSDTLYQARKTLERIKTEHYLKTTTARIDMFDRIPSGSIVHIIRQDRNMKSVIGTDMNVSHVGLAVRKEGTLYFRHASLVEQKVTDDIMQHYLMRHLISPDHRGIHILRVNELK